MIIRSFVERTRIGKQAIVSIVCDWKNNTVYGKKCKGRLIKTRGYKGVRNALFRNPTVGKKTQKALKKYYVDLF